MGRATPAGWHNEFTDDERFLRLVMAGEYKFAEGFLRSAVAEGALADSVAGSIETTFSGRWLHYVAKPLFQEQDALNGVAELRDPYSLAPFTWDAQRVSVSFTGPEEHMWRRNEFFY